MREILFRGKAINRHIGYHTTNYKNGDWVYGLITKPYNERFENLPAEMTNTDGIRSIEIDHTTVGQYTGLTDKNGKKIFEGDILRKAYYPEDDKVVLWNDGRFKFKRANKVNKDYPFESECCVQNAVKRLKIIGNIHDNPELLKEADNE